MSQQQVNLVQGKAGSASSGSVAVTLDNKPTTKGNRITVSVRSTGVGLSVSDNFGNPYQQIGVPINSQNGSFQSDWYSDQIQGAGANHTITVSGPTLEATVRELNLPGVSGNSPTPIEQIALNTGELVRLQRP